MKDYKNISIYGFGNNGKRLLCNLVERSIKVACVIDKKFKEPFIENGITFCDLNFAKTLEIDLIIISIFNRDISLKSIEVEIRNYKSCEVISFLKLKNIDKNLVYNSYWYDLNDKLDIEKLNYINNKLTDEKSKITLNNIINFRNTLLIDEEVSAIGLHKQYFDDEIIKNSEIELIDCGAYDGDSLALCIENGFNLIKAMCFEPDNNNFDNLKKRIEREKIDNVFTLPFATWSCVQLLNFDLENGESSKFSSSGNKLQAVSVDSIVGSFKFNFLKIDVEGADLETLKGAENFISKNHPIIAVSIYHLPDHLWEIPFYLMKKFPHYKFYIRQYGFQLFDTILYCIP